MTASLLFLSPHPDDVAFSCFAAISKAKSESPMLVTVFSESEWTAAHGFAPQSRLQTTSLRRAEDQLFAAKMGCTYFDLGLPDSGVRGLTADECYDHMTRRELAQEEVEQRLRQLIETLSLPQIIFVPLGLGNHIDHLIVRDVAQRIFARLTKVVYYEDLPYALRLAEGAIAQHVRQVAPEAEAIWEDIASMWECKVRALQIYKSQLLPSTIERISAHAKRIAPLPNGMFERYWHTENNSLGEQNQIKS